MTNPKKEKRCVSRNGHGLVAHWTGNGTAADASSNGHDATLNGATYGTGMFGQAFSFDGVNDYISVPGNAALEPSIISVAMWVKAAPASGIRLLVDTNHGGSGAVNQNGWAVQIEGGTNKLNFTYGNGSVFPNITSSSVVADNTFHHVVAMLDGANNLRIFVDGTEDATAVPYSGTPTDSTANGGNIRMGDHYQFSRPLNGLLDEVVIYNHALSQAEVSALQNNIVVPEPSTFVLAILSLMVVGMASRRRRSLGDS